MIDQELLRILRGSKILRGITDDHLKEISAHAEILNISENDFLIKEGQIGHPLNIILEGEVEVFLPKSKIEPNEERPTKIILDRLSQGDCTGEYSLIDNKPASASVVAMQPCKIFRLSKDNFDKVIGINSDLEKTIYKNMLKILIQRCRRSDSDLDICY